MAQTEMRIRVWACRRWWVDPFLAGFLPIAHVMKFFAGDRGADAAIWFVGTVIGRFGIKTGVE